MSYSGKLSFFVFYRLLSIVSLEKSNIASMNKHKIHKEEQFRSVELEELFEDEDYLLTYVNEKEVGVLLKGKLMKLPKFLSVLSPPEIRLFLSELDRQKKFKHSLWHNK